jgi:asparagine synthase (glutamine-hydrolysing)
MCGIAGIFNRDPQQPVAPAQVNALLGAIHHRGPETAGMVLDGPVGLGHDRLSIIDLAGGLQPIPNEDGSIWIICNGEVFNYVELRAALIARGHRFRTGSDSEVIVHLYEDHGPACVHDLIGQFAFALWDRRQGTLLLARDRLGVRPLFYAEVAGALLFASEIKALLADPRVPRALDLEALDQVFTYWAPLPGRTAFRGVEEVPPGHYLLANRHGCTLRRYWTLDFSDEPAGPGHGARHYAERLLELLIDATRLRLRADVPVGAYLSGGLDSSAIAAVVCRYTGNPLKTFSIAFSDSRFDEREHQQRMADVLGTEHISLVCDDADIGAVFPDVIRHAEMPLLRTAPAPMYLLARQVRAHGMKVVLTGEGSDESFGGYDIFKEARIRRFWAARPESRVRPLLLQTLYTDIANMTGVSAAYRTAFFKQDLAAVDDLCYSHRLRWRNTARLKRLFSASIRAALADYTGEDSLALALDGMGRAWHPLSQAQFIESRIFLSQYLLSAQGDRMAMAHAVEGRFPFLDHRLVEFAATIPAEFRLRGLDEKYILKRALADVLRAAVLARTKRPYRAPIRNVFFGPQAPAYVRDMLSPDAVAEAGIFDPAAVGLLVKKCQAAPDLGEVDSMGLVGVLSTQLLYHQFIAQGTGQRPTTPVSAVILDPETPALPALAMAGPSS